MSILKKLIQSENDAREFGFDWPDPFMVLDQIIDECREIRDEINQGSNQEKLQEEIGDLFHAAISLCIFSGFDLEQTLEKTNLKFSKRMMLVKALAKNKGLKDLRGQNIDFMLSLWKEAKKLESSRDFIEGKK
ncbi:MAG: MazG nucleotide pyrophosphohydrolase domain-containing protein [Gammaproteobacteria bacterium]